MKKLLFLFLTLTVNCSLFTDPRLFGGQACLWASSPNTISYQGRLRESGQPVSGIRSIQFKLFDASSAGTEVFNSGAQAIYVSSGIFGYQLGGESFKNLSWATSSYWLEISVGGNAMSPREQINAMPYAFMASTAASLNGFGNIQISGAGPHYINNGNVGIGVTNPAGWFQIGPGTFTVLSNGNVGIGTTNPTQKLTVAGDIYVSSSIYGQKGVFTLYSADFRGANTVPKIYMPFKYRITYLQYHFYVNATATANFAQLNLQRNNTGVGIGNTYIYSLSAGNWFESHTDSPAGTDEERTIDITDFIRVYAGHSDGNSNAQYLTIVVGYVIVP